MGFPPYTSANARYLLNKHCRLKCGQVVGDVPKEHGAGPGHASSLVAASSQIDTGEIFFHPMRRLVLANKVIVNPLRTAFQLFSSGSASKPSYGYRSGGGGVNSASHFAGFLDVKLKSQHHDCDGLGDTLIPEVQAVDFLAAI